MVIGWRMDIEERKNLAELPPGNLHFDILTGQATHDSLGSIHLAIATEMQAWFRQRLEKDGVQIGGINSATLDMDLITKKLKTGKTRQIYFDCRIRSRISTDEKVYEAEL